MSALPRRVLIAAIAFAIAAVLVLIARRAADAPATSDTAVIESYTLMASQGRLLVGAYSRFQWHHPGPLYFFLLAPFYVLAGDKTAGLNAGAAAISVVSMAIIAMVLIRRKSSLSVAVTTMIALFAWRAAEALASPWNPHVPLLPAAALIVAAADVLGGMAMSLPVVAALASLCGQAHIALMPCALVVGGLAAGRAIGGALHGADRRRWWRSLALTGVVLVLTWALPAYEQLTATPRGNVTELWQFFAHHARAGQTLSIAVSAWSDMLVGVLRPDFYVAHGWPFVESPVRWAEWLTLVELLAVFAYGIRAVWRREVFEAAFALLLLVVSAVTLWSTTRIDERIFDHDIFWISGIGVLNLAVVIDLVASSVLARRALAPVHAIQLLSLVLLAVASGLVIRQVSNAAAASFNPSADAQTARALASDLEAFIKRERVGRPLIKIDQDAWGVAAGAILDLQKHGRLVSVEDDWVVMFTPMFRINGSEDAVVTVAMPPEHLRLAAQGVRMISAHEPIYAHVSEASRR